MLELSGAPIQASYVPFESQCWSPWTSLTQDIELKDSEYILEVNDIQM